MSHPEEPTIQQDCSHSDRDALKNKNTPKDNIEILLQDIRAKMATKEDLTAIEGKMSTMEKSIEELKPLNDRMTAMENSISTIRNSYSGLEDQIINIKGKLNQTPGLAIGRKPSIFDYPVSRRNSITNPDIDLYPIDAYRKKVH
jgi:uncharacterized protein YPO0396